MSHNIADLLVALAHGYLILGILFAMAVVTRGVTTEQKRAAGTHEPGEFRDERAGRERAAAVSRAQRTAAGLQC